MKIFIALAIALCAVACSSAPRVEPPLNIFADSKYGEPPPTIRQLDVFALSPEMQSFLDHELWSAVSREGPARGLYAVMNRDLRIDYDAELTRTAAETFKARAGNCLSLVLLTSAFAKRIGLTVRYQLVHGEPMWSRVNGVLLLNGHVNVAIEPRRRGLSSEVLAGLVIDFLPSADLRWQRTSDISESRVVAMYLNNRAAETLVAGQVEQAYWWARAALSTDSSFAAAYNTLGVIHRRHGESMLAERSFLHALALQDDNEQALSNLAGLFDAEGRAPEAAMLRHRLDRLDSDRPFALLDRGNALLASGNPGAALHLYQRELARMPYNAEVNYAIAVASARLGRDKEARKYLAQASQLSTSVHDHDIYASKLQKLQALHVN